MAGVETYAYNDAAIIAGMEAIKATHNAIDTRLDQCETTVEGYLAAWFAQDGSRDEYTAHKKAWDAAVDKMAAIMIDTAIPSLNEILTKYQSAERINQGIWQLGAQGAVAPQR